MIGRKLTTRERRLLVGGLAVVFVALLVDRVFYRIWLPRTVVETSHYRIQTTATRAQAEEAGRALEVIYATYRDSLGDILPRREVPVKLQAKLYKNKKEFNRCCRYKTARWAEAFYRDSCIHAYYPSTRSTALRSSSTRPSIS